MTCVPLLVMALMGMAACSSGDDDGKQGAGPAPTGVAADAVATPSDSIEGGAAAAADTTVPGGKPARAGVGAGASTGGAGAAATGVAGPGPRVVGKGITDTTIHLGFIFADSRAYNAAGAALGGKPNFYEPDDPKGIQNAVIEYVNATGGIAGRKVVPVWHEILVSNAVTKEGRTRDAQTACAVYTEDHKVFAFMGSGQWTEDNIVECAARSKTVLVDGWSARTGVWLSEQRMGQVSDYYYTLSGLTTERRERAMVKSLQRQNFFTPGARVGLMTENAPSIRQGVERALKPALAALGVNVVTEAVYPDIIESPWQNYVLQFQSNQVTHVIFSASTAESWPTLLFMRGAENQNYRPRYGISGLPAVWLVSNAPKDQIRNAYGFNWASGYLGEIYPPVSPTDKVCRDIMKKKGHPETIGASFCDYVFFLKDSLERAAALTPPGLSASAATLAGGWKSTLMFEGVTRFGPNRHDGAELIRDFAWNEGKGRFDYTSGTYAAG